MIDSRGLSCPLPVLKAQKEIEKNHPATLEILVDNDTAVQNLKRFASHSGYAVAVRTLEDDEYSLVLTKA